MKKIKWLLSKPFYVVAAILALGGLVFILPGGLLILAAILGPGKIGDWLTSGELADE